MASYNILDCTLRDGGYINNWEFNTESAINIIENLYQAGIRIIEIGVLGKTDKMYHTTKFHSLEDSQVLLQNKHDDCLYAMMMTYSEKDLFEIKPRTKFSVDIIRVAFFKPDYYDAVKYASELKEKGYLVFLQAMASHMYTNEEWQNLLECVNNVQPYSFYFVDSFGTFYNDDIRDFYVKTKDVLSEDIKLGFHAHNNIQMAFSNVLYFLEIACDRSIIFDTSVHGMGRGAGNVNTELILHYLNEKRGEQYSIDPILHIYDAFLSDIMQKEFWGYSLKYFLTSIEKINPGYIWLLGKNNITELQEISKIIRQFPEDMKFSLHREELEKIICKVKGEEKRGK